MFSVAIRVCVCGRNGICAPIISQNYSSLFYLVLSMYLTICLIYVHVYTYLLSRRPHVEFSKLVR